MHIYTNGSGGGGVERGEAKTWREGGVWMYTNI